MTEQVMPAPPPIELEQFERMVYSRRHTDAVNELCKIILGIKQGAGIQWAGENPSVDALFTRVASGITSLFADPTFALTYDGFAILASNHATFHSLFRVSSFKNTDYLVNLIGNRMPADPARINFQGATEMPKLLLCWSLESSIDLDFERLVESMPEFIAVALVGILGIGGIHTQKAYDRKLMLMRMSRLLGNVRPHDCMVVPMCDVYMHCSYVDAPDKHDIKRILNKQMRNLVEIKSLEFGKPIIERHTLTRKERPTIVIPVEWFGSHHAMFRCYAPSIRQLREHFRVVCIARESDVDEVSEKEFDKCVKIPTDRASIFDLSQAVAAEEPDIMFYPSIGMAGWWVALSNFRLAPIQIMCPGHPATTHSDCIDYVVSDGDLFGDEAQYSEKCVHLPVGSARYINSTVIDRQAFKRPDDGVVRIAVPAMAMKLVPPFLAACKRINEGATVKVELHFFPNMIAMFHHLITSDLQQWVPHCVVHHRLTYADYLKTLAHCDLMLSSFPFCGTNSVIDAYLVGMPVICMEGNQIHSRSGASMNRRVGLPEGMIAQDADSYVKAALYYINFEGARKQWQQHLMETDVEAEFYGEGRAEIRGKFGASFWNIYEMECDKHEQREQGQRVLESIG